MYFIPVIDVKEGIVVHAVAGQRKHYRPLVSCLTNHPSAANLAIAYRQLFDCRTVYLADLDALSGGDLQCTIYESVVQTGVALWLDAGVANVERARLIFDMLSDAKHCLIVAAETLHSKQELCELVHAIGKDRLIFSLDLRHGKLNTLFSSWRTQPILEVVAEIVACGVERVIVLDLADVGVSQSASTLSLVGKSIAQHPQLKVITGGGVRNKTDLLAIQKTGCEAALVATALHNGQLKVTDCLEFLQPQATQFADSQSAMLPQME
jgi:phosphoribosylformimino-5-aminoimidazole carboxamide ribotide isomerase